MGSWLASLGNALIGIDEFFRPLGFYLRRTVVQQLYFTAVQAFWLIGLLGVALGVLVAFPLLSLGLTQVDLQAQVMKVALFHQMAPLLTALVVVGRSGTALTAELGEFRTAGVLDALRMLGIDPDRLILLPRLLAITVSLLLLTFWANVGAVVGAGAYNWAVDGVSFTGFVHACTAVMDPLDAFLTVLMVLAYGCAMVLVQYQFGLASGNVVELQRNLPRAFVRSLQWCVGLTLLFTFVRS
jgi:phospholipid/cholesterol/gamma-HCH transport system permease protein